MGLDRLGNQTIILSISPESYMMCNMKKGPLYYKQNLNELIIQTIIFF